MINIIKKVNEVLKFKQFSLIETYMLVENRIDFLVKNYDQKILKVMEDHPAYIHRFPQYVTTQTLVDKLATFDPTNKKVYTQWLVGLWMKEPTLVIEDGERIKGDFMTDFAH